MSRTDPQALCAKCRFWERFWEESSTGQCRRSNPVTGWPETELTDWCGEFAPAEIPKRR